MKSVFNLTRVLLTPITVHITHPENPAQPDEFDPAWCITAQFDQPQTILPVHDHRDNFNGGLSFAIYHPGTALPQQPWFD